MALYLGEEKVQMNVYLDKSKTIRFQGESIAEGNTSSVKHDCNKSKYLFIINVDSIPENTNGIWYAKTVIGFYDENTIEFNGATYNTISSGTRVKDGDIGTVVWCSVKSTNNIFSFYGNSIPAGAKYTWELYDLTDQEAV